MDVFVALRPLFWASRIVGLAPYDYEKSKQPIPKVGAIYSFVIIAYLSFTLYYTWITNLKDPMKYFASTQGGQEFIRIIIVYIATVSAVLIRLLSVTDKEVKLMESLRQVDQNLYGNQINQYEKHRRKVILTCLGTYLWNVLEAWFCGFLEFETKRRNVWMTLPHLLIKTFIVVLFLNWLIILRTKFRKINDILRGIQRKYNTPARFQYGCGIDALNTSNTIEVKEKSLTANECSERDYISMLRVNHFSLVHVAENVNKLYGLCVVILFLDCCTSVVIHIFECIVLFYSSFEGKIWAFPGIFVSLSKNIGKIVAISLICDSLVKESNRTARLVQHLICNCWIKSDITQLKLFEAQLRHTKLRLTASGLFSLDNTLLSIFGAAVVTYTIIFFQFVLSERSCPRNTVEIPCTPEMFQNMTEGSRH